MKKYFGPTLLRRVFFASAIVYAAMWMILTCVLFFLATYDDTEDILRLTEARGILLDRFTSEQEAAAFMANLSVMSSRVDPAPYLELWSLDGKRVYFDDKHAFPFPPLVGDPRHISTVLINGRKFMIVRRDGERWSFRRAIAIGTLDNFIKYTGRHLNLQILLGALILLPPLFFAIMRGLLPLRSLSARLSERQAEDLSPLHFDAKYGEIKPLVAALDGLLLRLHRKVEREHAFVQDAAHELRTPMAVIAAEAHVLATAATQADRHDAERHIQHAIARATHLIGQLLELARVDGMRKQANPMADVAQLVRRDLEQMSSAAKVRQIALSIDAPPNLLHRVEQNTFQSIAHNLIDNAIRYGHAGGAVAVKLAKEGNDLWLSVTDNGPGIRAADRDMVFERFYRGVGNTASGSGLGLAIVRQAAARLGATVELADGMEGKGCRFTVVIPAEMQFAPLPLL